MKKFLNLTICISTTLLASCASYQSPTEGDLATLVLTNLSTAKTQVDYCYDKSCDKMTRITTLKNQEPHQIKVHANQTTHIRFFTKLYVTTFNLAPDSEVVNKKYECWKTVSIEPVIDKVYKLDHLFKSDTGQCNVQVKQLNI